MDVNLEYCLVSQVGYTVNGNFVNHSALLYRLLFCSFCQEAYG